MSYPWLSLARELESMARAGLTYSETRFDQERYTRLLQISKEIIAAHSDLSMDRLDNLYSAEEGYLTPKVDVRGLVMRGKQVLLVKEIVDDKWSLPGGWADVGHSPGEMVEKEVMEESGLLVKAERLLAVLDKAKHDHPPDIFYIYKLFFHCVEIDGQIATGTETSDAGFFHIDRLPELSTPRNTVEQIQWMYKLATDPSSDVFFD